MSVTFDDGVAKAMSEFLVAVNRHKHAKSRPAHDPHELRRLAADESRAAEHLAAELQARGWSPAYGRLPVGA